MRPSSGRSAVVATGAAALALFAAAPGASAAPPGAPPAASTIARLLIATAVRVTPAGAVRGRLAAVRPITGQGTALPVLRRQRADGDDWLLVRLPGRPAGRVGWIAARDARLVATRWHVVVQRAARRVLVYRAGSVVERLPVVVGAASTPTPRGHYFVVEHVRQAAGSRLGPWALATSAYSHVLQEFDGGPGQIALHGRAGELARDPLGTARSHGCIRFDNAAIRTLSRLPNGTPVDID